MAFRGDVVCWALEEGLNPVGLAAIAALPCSLSVVFCC